MSKTSTPLQHSSSLSFNVFHDLMSSRVRKILLVCSPYDAFIMEEDGQLAERITHEYRGLNLTLPPALTWASSAQEALDFLEKQKFDLVITMPRLEDMDPYYLGSIIKKRFPDLFVYLLEHNAGNLIVNKQFHASSSIDKMFVWNGNTDLLLSIIKNIEDKMNVLQDTKSAGVRVIILVEDSPIHTSSILPIIYKEVVIQTQAAMEDSINEAHRLLMMRARPKILVAETYEEAIELYQKFKPYLLSVFSDVRFPRNGKLDDKAGFILLEMIKEKSPGMPVLVLSSEEANREKAYKISAVFLNKNSFSLHKYIRSFLVNYLAFGKFRFLLPDGREVAKASNLREMEKILPSIPEESIFYHAIRDHFSTWLMARSEIELASKLQVSKVTDFSGIQKVKDYLILCLKESRINRQKGIVTNFIRDDFDPDTEFIKIGKGSIGGKGRGLAFLSNLINSKIELSKKFPEVTIQVPKTLVISTDGFDSFLAENNLSDLPGCDPSEGDCIDKKITETFYKSNFPGWLRSDLKKFLEQIKHPLAVRSSSLLEDAQYMPCAGVYHTYMIPNNHPDIKVRLDQLVNAVKMVYASTFMEIPRTIAQKSLHSTEEEKMAVIIQQIIGARYGEYFYPAVSGIAQSYNYYPLSCMKSEEGIVHIAFGLGKTVVEGGKALRFSPKYPKLLPQFSTVDDILQNSQRFFFALKMNDSFNPSLSRLTRCNDQTKQIKALARLEIDDIINDVSSANLPLHFLAGTYVEKDHRIRDTITIPGHRVLTFSQILKYNTFSFSDILLFILKMGQQGMGCPVEIEFAVNLPSENEKNGNNSKPEFALLQIRPMALCKYNVEVQIDDKETVDSFCFSDNAMGNGILKDILDIVYVKNETFEPAFTVEIAAEIRKINNKLKQQNRKYILIGPGRWGSADRWLGIPVVWHDISGVGVIVETSSDNLNAEPSQGTHFFHNITSLGIGYITVSPKTKSFIDFAWLSSLPFETESRFLKHVILQNPVTIKLSGKDSRAVILKYSQENNNG